MKLTKIAQNVPSGYFILEVRTNKNGTHKEKIIRGNGGTSCNEDAAEFLRKLLNAQVPGFGGQFGGVSSEGRTEEFYKQTAPKPQPVEQVEQQDLIPPVQQQQEEAMGLGYGV